MNYLSLSFGGDLGLGVFSTGDLGGDAHLPSERANDSGRFDDPCSTSIAFSTFWMYRTHNQIIINLDNVVLNPRL